MTRWMGKFVVVLAFLVVVLGIASASTAPEVVWEKKLNKSNDAAFAVQQTIDGGYIVAGGTNSEYDTNAWIVKLDANGNVVWEKEFGNSSSWDCAYDIKQTSDGGYVFAGVTSEYGSTAWVVKLDSNGNMVWEKELCSGESSGVVRSIQQTDDGGYIVAGGCDGPWVAKLDSNGNIVWEKRWEGMPWHEEFYAVQQTKDGGYILAGTRSNNSSNWNYDAWVVKLDANGNVIWEKMFGGYGWDEAHDVKQTSDGGYIVAGSYYSDNSSDDAWVIKLDANGNLVWEKKLGYYDSDSANAIQQTSDGGYIVVGEYGKSYDDYDVWVIKLDSNGNVVWDKKLGGSGVDWGWDVQQTSDGGYVVVGLYYNGNDNDAWVIKLGGVGGLGILKMEPSTSSPTVNSTFTVDVVVKNAGSIMAMTADVVNTSNVDYIGVEKYPDGWIKLSDNPIRVFTMDSSKAIDTTNGATILTLKFKALSEGNATINLSNITVKDTNGNLITIPPSSLTIFISKSIIDSYDKNHDGKISIDELINAFDDWISGNISTDQFILVFDAWMSS